MTDGLQSPRQGALIDKRVKMILAGQLKPGQALPGDAPPGGTPRPADECPSCHGKMKAVRNRGFICLKCQ